MMSHSPAPWRLAREQVLDRDGNLVAFQGANRDIAIRSPELLTALIDLCGRAERTRLLLQDGGHGHFGMLDTTAARALVNSISQPEEPVEPGLPAYRSIEERLDALEAAEINTDSRLCNVWKFISESTARIVAIEGSRERNA